MLREIVLLTLCFCTAIITGCSTVTDFQEKAEALKHSCATSPVLIADLTKPQPLNNTQLPDGRSCQGEQV